MATCNCSQSTVHAEKIKENVDLPGPRRDVMAAGMLGSLRSEDQVLYLTAGLWCSRACVTTRKSRIGTDRDGTRWCTLYSRIDNTFPSRKERPMLELRVEATLATVFAAVSFLVAALGCCSSRHHGRRAIAALITMFLSGAIMMVPVVHMIIHHNMAAHNHVNKPKLASNYMPHDLAGHYSIIVTGIGSLIAVLAAIVITVVKCRSPSELSNEYNLDRKSRETDGRKEKHELPIHWIRNTNIALPPVTASTMDELHGDDSESGYSDLKDEDSASGSHEPNGQAETA